MTQFVYQTTKTLEPRGTNKFATTYYQMTERERQRVVEHMRTTMIRCLKEFQDLGNLDVIHEPLPGFPKTRQQPNYNFWQIVGELYDYVLAGRDIPSGMLGRWNRLFGDNPEFQIELVSVMEQQQAQADKFDRLFQ